MKPVSKKEQIRIEDELLEANNLIGHASNIFNSFSDSHELRQLSRIQEADRHILDAHRIIEAILTKARPDDGLLLSPIEERKRLSLAKRSEPYVLWVTALVAIAAALGHFFM